MMMKSFCHSVSVYEFYATVYWNGNKIARVHNKLFVSSCGLLNHGKHGIIIWNSELSSLMTRRNCWTTCHGICDFVHQHRPTSSKHKPNGVFSLIAGLFGSVIVFLSQAALAKHNNMFLVNTAFYVVVMVWEESSFNLVHQQRPATTSKKNKPGGVCTLSAGHVNRTLSFRLILYWSCSDGKSQQSLHFSLAVSKQNHASIRKEPIVSGKTLSKTCIHSEKKTRKESSIPAQAMYSQG